MDVEQSGRGYPVQIAQGEKNQELEEQIYRGKVFRDLASHLFLETSFVPILNYHLYHAS